MISKDFVQKKQICAFSSLSNTIAKGDKWLCIITVHLEWVTESRALFPVLHCHGNNLASHSGMAVYPVSGSFQFSTHYCESPCLSPWLTLIMKPRDRNLPLSHYSNKTIVLISLLCVCVCVCVTGCLPTLATFTYWSWVLFLFCCFQLSCGWKCVFCLHWQISITFLPSFTQSFCRRCSPQSVSSRSPFLRTTMWSTRPLCTDSRSQVGPGSLVSPRRDK